MAQSFHEFLTPARTNISVEIIDKLRFQFYNKNIREESLQNYKINQAKRLVAQGNVKEARELVDGTIDNCKFT